MSLISALRKEGQADLCEFEASLVYRMSTRTARATHSLKKKKKKKKSIQAGRHCAVKPLISALGGRGGAEAGRSL